ncbi:MAG: hypothetical protein A4E71_00106 [Smithella sp. PtaU1.Bin162]|nr:MAG: hypothetical protein A4E71_00106 [Smithella sp. PtaU1.Bin162]
MFRSIINWFKSLFASPNVKALAKLAIGLVIKNNKEKATKALPTLKAALSLAKTGEISMDAFQKVITKLTANCKDKEIINAFAAFITLPRINVGEVSQDAVDILETIVSAIEAE